MTVMIMMIIMMAMMMKTTIMKERELAETTVIWGISMGNQCLQKLSPWRRISPWSRELEGVEDLNRNLCLKEGCGKISKLSLGTNRSLLLTLMCRVEHHLKRESVILLTQTVSESYSPTKFH